MLQALIGPVTGLLDKFIPDADQKAKLAHDIATMSEKHAQELALAQIEVNKAEAASGSIFKARWRPLIGWISDSAFAYHFMVKDLIIFVQVCRTWYYNYHKQNLICDGTLLTVWYVRNWWNEDMHKKKKTDTLK